jgi:hypothetical protein
VVSVLRTRVRRELDKLTAITRMTSFFNDAVGDVAGVGVSDVNSAVGAIPSPVSTNFLDLLGYVTCPLTPLALGLDAISDLTNGDLNTQLKAVQSLGTGTIDKSRRAYESTLNNSVNAKLIRQSRKYERQLRQIGFNQESFAEAVLITATVQSVCDDDEFDDVFEQFAQLSQGFSFVGGVPGTLDNNLAAMIQQLSAGELKFKALRESLHSLS